MNLNINLGDVPTIKKEVNEFVSNLYNNRGNDENRAKYADILEWCKTLPEAKLESWENWENDEWVALYVYIRDNYFKRKMVISGNRENVGKINGYLNECPTQKHYNDGGFIFLTPEAAAYALKWLFAKLRGEFRAEEPAYIRGNLVTWGNAKIELTN